MELSKLEKYNSLNMTSIEKYNWYKEHEEEIEAFFKECFKEWFEEYISKLPDIKDVKKYERN